ncbi:MAG: nucleotide sugar dehydrogenase [Clostridiales bacterium]
MRISIFGLGYVGVVSAACLSNMENFIIGVDINDTKVDMLNKGISPIIEKDLDTMLKKSNENGSLIATNNVKKAINETEFSLICVGTPSRSNGSLNISYLENVCIDIGRELKHKKRGHILIFRSTMIPGTMRSRVIPVLEEYSEKEHNKDFFTVFNPEFLREATAIDDFYNPPKTVIGSDNESISNIVADIYSSVDAPIIKTKLEIAEMVKYVDNNFHALKITFANEIGQICNKIDVNSHEVMNIFKKDEKLNISKAYLSPGFAFGGSCLPKDLRAINYLSKMIDVETPLLSSIIQSNNNNILNTIKKIISFKKRHIGIAGLSFKEGTDDLRESPMVEVIETLIGKGYNIRIYDKNVSLAKLIGANKDYLINHIPHISTLMVDSIDELIKSSEILVIGNKEDEFNEIIDDDLINDDQIILDLVGIGDMGNERENYHGICW